MLESGALQPGCRARAYRTDPVPMALPPATADRLLEHRRSIEVRVFVRKDGRWEVDARLIDLETPDSPLASGARCSTRSKADSPPATSGHSRSTAAMPCAATARRFLPFTRAGTCRAQRTIRSAAKRPAKRCCPAPDPLTIAPSFVPQQRSP